MKIWISYKSLSSSLGGIYNIFLGNECKKIMLEHEDALKDEVKKVCNVDLREQINSWGLLNTNFKSMDEVLTSKLYGFKDVDEYYYKASCIHSVPHIKTPSLFVNALDDPLVGNECIDYEVFKRNQNVAVATTQHGGHMGYGESIFTQRVWVLEPCLKFFNALVQP